MSTPTFRSAKKVAAAALKYNKYHQRIPTFDKPGIGKQRGPFLVKPRRTFEDRNRVVLNAYKDKRLALAPAVEQLGQWRLPEPEPDPKIVTRERKLPSLSESRPPYQQYSPESISSFEKFETYYDPLFNPHLHEERYRVNPEEEPFEAIYSDSKSEASQDYTTVRNITTPQLWEFVERLARIKIAPDPVRRKAGEKPYALPSGFVPPPETPPDLPYFVPRTRNYLLPVYYKLDSDPDKCFTEVKQVSGDLWQLEEDLRTHLESLSESKRRILTSVQETDDRILFRGKYLHEVVAWLHEKGF